MALKAVQIEMKYVENDACIFCLIKLWKYQNLYSYLMLF